MPETTSSPKPSSNSNSSSTHNIITLLNNFVKSGASDIFIVAGLPLSYKKGGQQFRSSEEPLSPQTTQELIKQIYTLANHDFTWLRKQRNHDEDFSFAIPGTGRFRINAFKQRGSYAAVIRIIPFGLPDPKELHIPEAVLDCADFKKGLVLVTGPASAGKSTTLACLLNRINHTRTGHIITMEDPIEYLHNHGTCIVTQREVPTDIATYGEGLKSAMRESPDIILLGEMRDSETIATAMTAAEMSQLVFSTLHTTSAAGTVDRIIDAFPANQQKQIRMQLSMVLKAVISQQLLVGKDGALYPAFEIMLANTAIRNLIKEGKTYQLDAKIASSREEGMISMDQSLFNMVSQGIITSETALYHAIHEESLAERLQMKGLL